jgi:hypothetical protein
MKISLGLSLLFLLITQGFATSLINANDARIVTNKSTKEAINKLMNSEDGKNAYNGIINLINNEISNASSGGYYNKLKFFDLNDKTASYLKPFSEKERDILCYLIVEDLKKNGYIIDYGTLGRIGPNLYNISISW